ncbi:TorF family putative porin [Shewanella sp. GXUN23E]|uniref:TorF family putative porin n=1 Tax=Shewanella sp. GXUN23E TaxID=3422498 RepID=UPI003D7DA715
MKKYACPAGIVLCLVSLSPLAQAGVSGNLGVSSNYLWRGISQTGNGSAVQGGLDYSHDSGFYAGTWVSNVDFGDDTSYELDLFAGFSGELSEGLAYDLGYVFYGYPDADASVDFGELYASVSWQWLTLGYAHIIHAGNAVAGDGLDDKDLGYLNADINIPLTDKLTLTAHYGYSHGDVSEAWFGTDHYSDYSLALAASTELGEVSFTLSDTDLAGDDIKAVIGYSYQFDL